MNIRALTIYCFSGTGNTFYVASVLKEKFEAMSVSCEIRMIPCKLPDKISTPIIVCFPVYAQSAPPLVLNWLSLLPVAENVPAVVITTYASSTGLVNSTVKNILLSKSYQPTALLELRMPSNYITQKVPEKSQEIIFRAEEKIATFADEFVNGKAHWKKSPGFLIQIQKMSSYIFAKIANMLGKKFYADKNLCTKCGLCIDICPVNNISRNEESLPVWLNKCQQCLRCINLCPAYAITTKSRIFSFIYNPKYFCAKTSKNEFIKKIHEENNR